MSRSRSATKEQRLPQNRSSTPTTIRSRTARCFIRSCGMSRRDFRHRRPDGSGGWIWKAASVGFSIVCPELIKFPDGRCLFAREKKTLIASPHSATARRQLRQGTGRTIALDPLKGRDVLILEDNDDAGRKKAEDSREGIVRVPRRPASSGFPGLGHGQDVSDWLEKPPRITPRLRSSGSPLNSPLWAPPEDITRPVVQI